jgi:hypothetical protein
MAREMPSKISSGPKDLARFVAMINDMFGSIPFGHAF